MSVLMIICIVVVLCIGICSFVWLNKMIKSTNYYLNQNPYLEQYKEGMEEQLEVVNLGSTYARYAFGDYDNIRKKCFNFAINHQGLEMDYNILKNYTKNIKKGSVVFIVLSVCIFLYKEKEGKDIYYDILDKKNNPFFSFFYATKRKMPLLSNMKLIKKIVKDDEEYINIYARGRCIEQNQAKKNMNNLVNIWKKLFNISDFHNLVLDKEKIDIMSENVENVKNIIDWCEINDFCPIIVIPPVSRELISYFDEDGLQKILYSNISKITANRRVQVMDYLKEDSFYDDIYLFNDGGYCLSKRGSIQFLRKIFMKL